MLTSLFYAALCGDVVYFAVLCEGFDVVFGCNVLHHLVMSCCVAFSCTVSRLCNVFLLRAVLSALHVRSNFSTLTCRRRSSLSNEQST